MSLKEKIKRFSDERWNVGFIENSIDSVMQGDDVKVNWVKHNEKDSWFADPFILDVTDDEIILLVEEFYKPIYRGRISRLTIDKQTFELKKIDVVLELPTHLSFPVIIRKDSDFGKVLNKTFGSDNSGYVWLMPENGEGGKLNVYKYWPANNHTELIASVLDEAVEDAIPVNIGKNTFLFCTHRTNPNGNQLQIYKWNESKFSGYSQYKFKENIARMAGMSFIHKGRLIRPTQECNIQYGHAITLQEIKLGRDNPQEFEFKEIRRIYDTNPKLTIGTHTFNMYKGVIVTDALGFDNLWLRKFLHKMRLL